MHAAQFFEADLISLSIIVRAENKGGATLAELHSWEEAGSRDTLGMLLKGLARIEPVSAELRQLWNEALLTRNRLAHGFFWSHFRELSDPDAHESLVSSLKQAARTFGDAAQAARAVGDQLMLSLGIDPTNWKIAQEAELARLLKVGA
jgi:hypothetical protein